MYIMQFKTTFLLIIIVCTLWAQARKHKSLVISLDDIKEYKKLLKSKTNVMILFMNQPKHVQPLLNVFRESADIMKGQATLATIDCNTVEGKKLCKKLKIPSEKQYYMRHYKDGEYHKDYDRGETVSSMCNFLRDPTGDLPWDEDPTATDIYHLHDAEALNRFLRRGSAVNKKVLVMFYAPWCGHCKAMKPEYIAAAQELKGDALLAAIDVSKPGNAVIRQTYNITGFPTLIYFGSDSVRVTYAGDNKRESLARFVRAPATYAHTPPPPPEPAWDETDTDVLHLDGDNWDSTLSTASRALVVFYAPWCGHCKRIKPELEKAAATLKQENIEGLICAVDATRERALATKYKVQGYPTIKYFEHGQYQYDVPHAREQSQIVQFIKDPKKPTATEAPEESEWWEEDGVVKKLHPENFRSVLRKAKHALVMFYAPWCGHCKNTKPELVEAASQFVLQLEVVFGAVDCVAHKDLCNAHNVTAYPHLKYYSHLDKHQMDYTASRKASDMVSFIHTQVSDQQKAASNNQGAGFGVNVLLSSDQDFEDIIADNSLTFVMFYASWCGHCVSAKPAFSRLATAVKTDNLPFKVVAVDAAENPKVADIASIQTLPTFKLFRSSKEVSLYEGDRSFEDMLSFIKRHSTKDEL